MQAPENDAVPGVGGEDDAAAFRRLQSRRKARGVEYLTNPSSPFCLMTSLTVAMVLSPVTNKAFQLCESDRKGISQQESVRGKNRLKRRLRTKGPEILVEEDAKHFFFRNIKVQALQACERLWSEILSGTPTTFACAAAFWPPGEVVRGKWVSLSENILRNIAALKWRLLAKFSSPPWSLCDVEDPDCSDDVVAC